MLLIVLIGLLIVVFAAFVYMQDGSDFTKLTKYSTFDLMFNKEVRMLHTIYKALQRVDGEREILLNVHVQDDTVVYKIPAVLVHESGVHVITNVNVDGWVVGSDRGIEWANVRYKKNTLQFENPVLVNRRYVYALRDNMVELPDAAFQSVVVFNNGCSFQKVEVSSENVEVLKLKELNEWADSLAGEALSAEDIATIYAALKDKMEFQKKVIVKPTKKAKKQLA